MLIKKKEEKNAKQFFSVSFDIMTLMLNRSDQIMVHQKKFLKLVLCRLLYEKQQIAENMSGGEIK